MNEKEINKSKIELPTIPTFPVCGFNLTFPWFSYPRLPFSGYYDEIFFSEMERLIEFLGKLGRDTQPILLHFTIGAPVEELERRGSCWNRYKEHYRQLIPIHLQRAVESGIKVINVVIAPNDLQTPHFMCMSDDSEMTFEKVDAKAWRCTDTDIDLSIVWFRTMLPTNDSIRNRAMMEQFKRTELGDVIPGGVVKYTQTEEDIRFTKLFYDWFTESCKEMIIKGSVVSCFNFAVFNSDGPFTRFNCCAMFNELRTVFASLNDLISEYGRFAILMEWVFRANNYYVYEINNQKGLVSICTNYVRNGIRSQDHSEMCNNDYHNVTIDVLDDDNSIVMIFKDHDEPYIIDEPQDDMDLTDYPSYLRLSSSEKKNKILEPEFTDIDNSIRYEPCKKIKRIESRKVFNTVFLNYRNSTEYKSCKVNKISKKEKGEK